MKRWLPLLLLAAAGVGLYLFMKPGTKVGTATVRGKVLPIVKADPVSIEAV